MLAGQALFFFLISMKESGNTFYRRQKISYLLIYNRIIYFLQNHY